MLDVIFFAPFTARILFTVEGGRMIRPHGFIKESRRTPRKDLRLARKRRDLSRSGSVS